MQMEKPQIIRILLLIGLIVMAAFARLLPHVPNVAPIGALALLGGAALPLPWSIVLPGAAMLLSDSIIGFDSMPITLAVYGSFAASALMGRVLRGGWMPWRLLGTSLASSILFYLVTNFAVWKFSGLYPSTLDGLALSYFYALPFFRNSLLGDLVYSFAIFGAWHAAGRVVFLRSRARVAIPFTQNLETHKQ